MKKILYINGQEFNFDTKYISQIGAWKSLGYKAEYFKLFRTVESLREVIREIRKFDLIYLRHGYGLDRVWFLIYPFLKEKNLILEFPSPISSLYSDIKTNNELGYIKKKVIYLLYKFYIKMILPKVDLIIEMAEEKDEEVLKYKGKIYLWQNGLNSIELYKINENYLHYQSQTIKKFVEKKEFHLVFIANKLYLHHGLDRLIHGLINFYQNKNDSNYLIKLHIVCSKTVLIEKFKKVILKNNLDKEIIFSDHMPIEKLQEVYKTANFCIGCLGLHRVDMQEATPLKTREATLMGLPSCISYHDYDLSKSDFIINLPKDDSPIDINLLIKFYSKLITKYGEDLNQIIHEFAVHNLTWQKKVELLEDECKKRELL
ncbi:glycosyltransferase [Aquella oligotrophica]|uniref:Glycosyltransferase n=1 Tax=Aquella oligotrophica TaxID=2067065 RepID=A0A2I7N9C8_9NEIS|nr:glycosyltransferase [Aquella oligotrophica]AUR53031.1 hypothetical protein CUN60_12255 [Aquella oligotrophica]